MSPFWNKKKPVVNEKSLYLIEKLGLSDEYESSPLRDDLLSVVENIADIYKQNTREDSENNKIEIRNRISFRDSDLSSPKKIGPNLEKITEVLTNKKIIAPDEQNGSYLITEYAKNIFFDYLIKTGVLQKGFNKVPLYG